MQDIYQERTIENMKKQIGTLERQMADLSEATVKLARSVDILMSLSDARDKSIRNRVFIIEIMLFTQLIAAALAYVLSN